MMTHMTGPIKAGVEPIPGYTLCHRLGAGGFGEVWLADAPGGLKKAIKLVYGTLEEDRANSELRSLQRIRQVHHPFLLSLERIEVVNGQIIIVTELAECSLVERFQQYRRKGLPGIPRENLLDFLRDASDALDFLSQKHDLQHLDVKPGNLLIIADRVKVADFGLVKDLQDNNQSLVGGLTPTYAAPEIFDGHPDRRSDQYSLAIVYQELLTGQMPFAGRTTAELARQHLSQQPNLEALPPADRPIIARALAKNPLDRFSSCRQLIDQLSRVRVAAPLVTNNTTALPSSKDTLSLATTGQPITSTSASLNGSQKVLPPLEVADSCQGWLAPRCVFIGLGGVGSGAIAELYKRLHVDVDTARHVKEHEWLAIDTDSASLDAITRATDIGSFPAADATQIQLFRPQEYRKSPPELFRSMSRRWLYNIPRSLQTEGVRPLGVLAFLDHYEQLRRTLQGKLSELVKCTQEDQAGNNEPIRVYIVSSIHGGTGSAIFAEIGYLVRDVFRQLGWRNYRLSGNLTVATTFSTAQSKLAAAAAVACCSELAHCMNVESMVPPIHFSNDQNCSNVQRPFDWVNLFDGGLFGDSNETERVCTALADSLWIDSQTMASSVLSAVRVADPQQELSWLHTVQTAKVSPANNIDSLSLSRLCCCESLGKAISYMLGSNNAATRSEFRGPFSTSETCTGDMPLTDNATDEILQRLMLQLRFTRSQQADEDEFLHAWTLRLSRQSPHNEFQFEADQQTFREWLTGLVRVRVYNWRQLEKLQLKFIEQLMNLVTAPTCELIDFLVQFEFPGTANEVAARIRAYLQRFAAAQLTLLQSRQKSARELSLRLRGWGDCLAAEKSLGAVHDLPSFESLAVTWQQVAIRVESVLDSTLQRLMMHGLFGTSQLATSAANTNMVDAEIESINLHYLMTLAHDLCDRFAKDFRLVPDERDPQKPVENGLTLQQLTDFLPALSQGGGDARRLLVVPQDHLQAVSQSLEKHGLSQTTTLVPAALSQTAYVIMDVQNLNLAHLVATWWHPNHSTFQIAERLRSRVDVDWPQVTRLIESREQEALCDKPNSVLDVDNPVTDFKQATFPINV